MVRLRFIEAEGTPEELMQIRGLFENAPEQVSVKLNTPEHLEPQSVSIPAANGALVTTDLVLRVLTRRELHANVKKVLKALLRAGPKGMSSEEVAKAVSIDRGQLAGVFGAFGRRIANTKGWPVGADIIAYRRDENGRKRYYLPDVVRTALEKFDL